MADRRRVSICYEGWYYLLVLLFIIGGAVLREVNLLVVLTGMMIGPMLFHWRLASLSLRRVQVRRRLPPRTVAGEPLLVDLAASNARTRLGSWMVVVEDRIAYEGADQGEPPTPVELIFPYLGPGQSDSASYRSRLTRRGRYRFGPLRISTRFPLGLVRAHTTSEQYQTLIVCPRLGRLSRQWERRLEAQRAGAQHGSPRRGRIEGDYYALREWSSGDSRRWIHWRSSAKTGELAVRQFEQQQNRDMVLILDLWQPPAASEQERGYAELAVSFAATVVAEQCRRGGSHLTCIIAGKTYHHWSATVSMMLQHEVLEQLAVIEGGRSEPWGQALPQVARQVQRGASAVVISTRSQPSDPRAGVDVSEGQLPLQSHWSGMLWIDVRGEQLSQFYCLE